MAELRSAQAVPRVTPRTLHAIRIEIGKDKGHVVHHEYRGGGPEYMGSGEEEGPHIFGADDGEELLAHIKKHAKIKTSDGEEELEDEHDTPREGERKHHKREKAKDEESHEDEGEAPGERAEEEEEHEED